MHEFEGEGYTERDTHTYSHTNRISQLVPNTTQSLSSTFMSNLEL